jgi:hypothetical protein
MSSTTLMIEPRADVVGNDGQTQVIVSGGSRITSQTIPAASYSDAGASWNVFPPSTSTLVDRFVRIRYHVEVTGTGGTSMNVGLHDAPRQFPIASIIDVLAVSINGESVSEPVAQNIHALACYGNSPQDRSKSLSTTAAQPDAFQDYASWQTLGSARSPFVAFGENSTEPSRGSVIREQVSVNVVRYTVTEPLWCSPFYQGLGPEPEAMVNVNQLGVTIRHVGSGLRRFWSSDGLTGTGYTATLYRAPDLLINYITPSLMQPIPAVQILPYHKLNSYRRAVPSLAAGASTQVLSDSVKLNQCPKSMMLFCKHSDASQNEFTSDSFLALENVSISFNNRSALLSSASPQELFEISRRSGLDMSFQEFSQYRGSVFKCDFARDIGLSDDEAPGALGQYTLAVQANLTNRSTAAFEGDFHVVLFMEGTISISENQCRASLGVLTPAMALHAKSGAAGKISHAHFNALHGGSFWSALKNVVKKVSGAVAGAAPIVGKIASALGHPEVGMAANTIGSVAGTVRGAAGGRLVGGRIARRML